MVPACIELEMARVKSRLDQSPETLNERMVGRYVNVLKGSLERYGRLPVDLQQGNEKEALMISDAYKLCERPEEYQE